MHLDRLGATPQLRALTAPELTLARITVSHRDLYRLLTDGPHELDGEPSGSLWYNAASRAAMPVVGDWVTARVINNEQAIVEAVLPRRTLFARRAAGRREAQQPIAANVDIVLLVCGLDGDFNVRRLERYLTLAAESGADPVIVLNKADLCGDLEGRMSETAAIARGIPIVPCSAREETSLDGLQAFLGTGHTV